MSFNFWENIRKQELQKEADGIKLVYSLPIMCELLQENALNTKLKYKIILVGLYFLNFFSDDICNFRYQCFT